MIPLDRAIAILTQMIQRQPLSDDDQAAIDRLFDEVRDGNLAAIQHIEAVVYGVVYGIVKRRMERDYPKLLQQHSAGSGASLAFMRKLRTMSPTDWNDPVVLILKIATLVRYALLDLVNDQREHEEHFVDFTTVESQHGDEGMTTLSPTSREDDPSDAAIAQEEKRLANEDWIKTMQCVEKLPPLEQKVFELRSNDWGNDKPLTFESIADMLGISLAMARRCWVRALEMLRKLRSEGQIQ